MDEIPDRPRKGRGAVSNRKGRYERLGRITVDDGWDGTEHEPAPRPTTLLPDRARNVLTENDSPDTPFAGSINPYRGCEYGCIYCFARPTHAYLGLSPGLDFETCLFHKPEAPTLLDRTLRAPRYRCQPLSLGANTDPYQPVERRLELTRRILRVLAAFRHPVVIVTKSALVLRDRDILAPMAEQRLVRVCVSITTLEHDLARRLEPRAAMPQRRSDTIRSLTAAGIPATVLVSPVIPGLTDHEMERILKAAAEAGANAASYALLRLPLELTDLFMEWLRAHTPDRAGRVLDLLRQARGGALYHAAFGQRMTGEGPLAELLKQRFRLASRRLGLAARRFDDLDCTQFRPPPRKGDQLTLC